MCQQDKLIKRTPGEPGVCYYWDHDTFAYAEICCNPNCPSHYQKLFDSGLISKEFYDYYSPDSTVLEPCCDERVKGILTTMTSMQECLTHIYLKEHQALEKAASVCKALRSTYRIAEHHGIVPDEDPVLSSFLESQPVTEDKVVLM